METIAHVVDGLLVLLRSGGLWKQFCLTLVHPDTVGGVKVSLTAFLDAAQLRYG
jgi:hypothetical protein